MGRGLFSHLPGPRRFRLDLLFGFLGLGLGRCGIGHRLGGIGFDHHQRGTDRHLVADLAGQLDHHARHRRFHLDRRLVRHHVGEALVLLHTIPDRHVPRDDLRLGDAFPNVRELEGEACH